MGTFQNFPCFNHSLHYFIKDKAEWVSGYVRGLDMTLPVFLSELAFGYCLRENLNALICYQSKYLSGIFTLKKSQEINWIHMKGLSE